MYTFESVYLCLLSGCEYVCALCVYVCSLCECILVHNTCEYVCVHSMYVCAWHVDVGTPRVNVFVFTLCECACVYTGAGVKCG